ncbi:hypothetical protein GTP45_17610 [Pseudoduganella sp. FT55W]|uniref:PIN domain-containing protein n=1 Tax=Duganella rivi TaxID=2666083 RepID=A0A7X4GS21_9BURK|nr:type II toxin-antitoxin system VapC family toxin [Duganella rivi]MYM68637.1 hypothetical protein [Duganella rivi]
MTGLDTNVLARYYIYDGNDAEAKRQRLVAQRLIDSDQPLTICKTVIIELEWVMRGRYNMKRIEIISIFQHMLSLAHGVVNSIQKSCSSAPAYQLHR